MPRYRVPCILCGVNVGYPRDTSAGRRLHWHEEHTIGGSSSSVRSQHGWTRPYLTGVGFLTDGPLVASDDWTVPYLDPLGQRSHHHVWYDSGVYWAFVFHDFCWRLLLGQVNSGSRKDWKPPDVAIQLFNYSYCLPWSHSNGVATPHGFGDAAIRPRLSSATNLGFFLASPDAQLLRDSYYAMFGLRRFVPPSDPPIKEHQVDPDADIFARLPPEVTSLIINVSHIHDLCNFRRASKTVANLAHPGNLPQGFWASRFAPDLEMGFWFAGSPPASARGETDWRDLYKRVRMAAQDVLPVGHARNRQHIWDSLRHATRCLLPMLGQQPLRRLGYDVDAELQARGCEAGQVAYGLERRDGEAHTDKGFRLLRRDVVNFPSKDSSVRQVEVLISFLVIHCTTYICGMRTLIYDEESPREVSRIGIITLSAEVALVISQDHSVVELEVTTALDGIIGFRLQFEDEAGRRHSQVVGASGKPPGGAQTKTLRPRQGCSAAGLIIGSDSMKLVTVQLIESPRQHIDANFSEESPRRS